MTSAQPAIRLVNVGVFRDNRWILRSVNWMVSAGSCCAILGPNGSGKSTLTRILAAHLWPSSGEVEVLGNRFGQTDLAELRHSIRLVQAAGPYDVDATLTARETVLTGFFGTLALYDQPTATMLESADRLLAQVGLSRVADHAYSTLSSGERVRALIARALSSEPKLLLLDEPTAGLDLLAREQVLATIQSLHAPGRPHPLTTILITHHVEELPPATSQILLLDDGVVAASGTPNEVLRAGILSRVYGCPLEVRHDNDRWSVHVHPDSWDSLLGQRVTPDNKSP
jgi:iron complex transport system ATP-binding protein